MFNFHTFTIQRLASPEDESGETNVREYTDIDMSVTGYLETASAEYAAMVDGDYGKTFRLFTDDFDAPVMIGDRLIEGENVYDVKVVQPTSDGPGRKLEITITLPIMQ